MQGARALILRDRPWILFEHGTWGAPYYGIRPETVFDGLSEWAMSVFLLSDFLARRPALTREAFLRHYQNGEYYFLAGDATKTKAPSTKRETEP